jgi:hypothetical protein
LKFIDFVEFALELLSELVFIFLNPTRDVGPGLQLGSETPRTRYLKYDAHLEFVFQLVVIEIVTPPFGV